ncbi:hypothetical protein AFM11_14265 [Mycolicibacterium wolinskyi]|uniref:Translation initiation factor IF-2 n=1 Tax=Mycolicibacterium wolinskyi TaxID=59750 RepID=A0A132PM86_9MYCO|nr:hypothetical protein [Mycolicibacterium wolinskyi]KWX23448.1 hypothetical protein AFM11_14265 [Mycolicibacterium wolinskyi]
MSELRVNVPELRAKSSGLEDAANSLPEPPQQFTSAGTDPLSQALTKLTQEKEASFIEALPGTKSDSQKTASDMGVAADWYEKTDQEIHDAIMKRVAEFDAIFGPPDTVGGGGTPASSGGQFGQLVHGETPAGQGAAPPAAVGGQGPVEGGQQGAQSASQIAQQLGQMPMQMMQVPMQMMQQAGQLPQGIMQGVQGGVEQINKLAGEAGKKDAGEKAQPEQQAPAEPEKREETAPPAPAGADDTGANTQNAPVGPPTSGGAPQSAAPVQPSPNRVPSDPSIAL